MAATIGKTINGKANPQIASVLDTSTLKGVSATNDTNLVEYVRSTAPYIVSALSCAASRAGEQQLWSEMQSYLGIANTVSELTGFAESVIAPAARTMTAASGASG